MSSPETVFDSHPAQVIPLPRVHPRARLATRREQPVSREAPRVDPIPFSACSLGACRLLAGFLLVADEAERIRPYLLDLIPPARSGAAPEPKLIRLVAAMHDHTPTACALDGLLASIVGRSAARYGSTSVAELAELWRSEKSTLRGIGLLGLVWSIARDNQVAVRPLERAVVRDTHPAWLLSASQRAHLFGPEHAARSLA